MNSECRNLKPNARIVASMHHLGRHRDPDTSLLTASQTMGQNCTF